MTREEFSQWFAQHCNAFTGLAAWFSRLPERPRTEAVETSQTGVMRSWFGVLHDVDLEDAIEATRLMFRDNEDAHFDRHPSMIRKLANRIAAPRRMEAKAKTWDRSYEPRFRCYECQDSGFRTVVHPRSIAAALRGETGFLYTCAVACPCPAGDERFADPPADRDGNVKRYPRFDAAKHCVIEHPKQADRIAALAAWLEGYKQRRAEAEYADQWEPANGSDYQQVIGGF